MSTFIRELKKTGSFLYDKIQPIPYIKKEVYSVDSVFIEVGMERQDERYNWKTLGSYHDIFPGEKGNPRIQIIEGDPGYGKSTLALQMVYDWCKEVPNSPFSRPDILICLNLRQLGGMESIVQAIKQFALPLDSELEPQDVEQLIRKKGKNNIWVIFDAYDEYPDQHNKDNFVMQILEGKILGHVNILLTTRSSCIPPGLGALTGRIRLTGFDDAAQERYIRKVVTGDNEAVKKILEQLNINPTLGVLCQAPLFSVMYAHLAHKGGMLHKLSSVTEFFGHMISCFLSHKQNKLSGAGDSPENLQTHADTHAALDKLAFEALTSEMQQLVWDRTFFGRKLGEEFYKLYVDAGILVEEEETYIPAPGKLPQRKRVVRFYHKLFGEWYAAYHLIECVKSRSYILPENINLYDLKFFLMFACGLDQPGGSQVIKLLGEREDGAKSVVLCAPQLKEWSHDIQTTVRGIVSSRVDIDRADSRLLQRSTIQLLELASQHKVRVIKFYFQASYLQYLCGFVKSLDHIPGADLAVLCVPELQERSHDILTTVRGVVSKPVYISSHDRLLLRSTIQLLELASQHEIPISQVWLDGSFSSVDPDSLPLVLHSGLCLPSLSTLQELVIATEYGREVTVDECTGLLNYAIHSQLLKELTIYLCLLPWMDSFPTSLDNVKVLWDTGINGHEYTLQSGRWQNDESGEILTRGAYDDLVTEFREVFRDLLWQKQRRAKIE